MDVNGRARDNKQAARLNAVEWVRMQFVASAIEFRLDTVETSLLEKEMNELICSRDLFAFLIERSVLIIKN